MGTGRRIALSPFGQFMASGMGRLTRIALGLALVIIGFFVGGTWGIVLGVVGIVPLAAGSLDICLLTGIAGGLWTGESVGQAAEREHLVRR